ncbi:MAG: serine protease [Acidobacteriia bacterium]|nr:serine protease [Terriglobia bacterium]
MKKAVSLAAILVVLTVPAFSQVETVKLKIRAVLVDKDLNQKPAPRLTLVVVRYDVADAEPATAKTSFDGTAELQLIPGRYRITTPEPIEFQGKRYSWEMEMTVAAPEASVELSNDNAKIADVPQGKPIRTMDDLASLFKKYQNCVVTVWSEFGHGTGFVVDPAGLILTNQHVIGPSEYVAVQFDEKRKVEAKVVAFDPEKDIAVLWASLAPFKEVIVAPLAKQQSEEATVVEGERVFTIGSPLNQQKILTTGVVSKVEPHAILSDININHGNSGGPLFSSVGTVVGLTTFADPDSTGPGVSGIVRIEEAELLLQRAKTKMRDISPPQAALLPVEPSGTYPIDALKASLQQQKFDEHPYIFGQGDYDVAIITPVLKYHLAEGARVQAQKEKEKRTRKNPQAIQETFRPLDDLKNWAEYTGEYRPVILIQANPKLRETFMSALGRGLANGRYAGPARMKFKTDFYRMKLLCGEKEVQPIQPGKIADVLNVHNPFVSVTDATYEGLYSYPYDAISSQCGTVTLDLFSEKEPNKPVSKVLDPKTLARITADFEPFRKGQIEVTTGLDSGKL